MLFISHDLSIVRRLADRIAVMYRGRIVEEGPAAALVERPLHPYTAALLSAVADPGGLGARPRIVLPPEPAESRAAEECPFAARCPIARDRCRAQAPPSVELEPGRRASCFFPGELAP
jgi:oligopeptide/dipeptide ABC transporter ATP-binding protein